jgi:hypothetical protein
VLLFWATGVGGGVDPAARKWSGASRELPHDPWYPGGCAAALAELAQLAGGRLERHAHRELRQRVIFVGVNLDHRPPGAGVLAPGWRSLKHVHAQPGQVGTRTHTRFVCLRRVREWSAARFGGVSLTAAGGDCLRRSQVAIGQLGVRFVPQTVVIGADGALVAARAPGVKGRLRGRDLADLLLPML